MNASCVICDRRRSGVSGLVEGAKARNAEVQNKGSFREMIRTVLATMALAIGVTAVAAQSDPIAARKSLMKANGDQAKIGAAMAKGEAPFDLAKAKTVFTTFADVEKATNLFPDDSKTGGETAALPKIWEDKADFNARLTKLAADSKAAAGSITDLDSFKTAWTGVIKQCGGCHEIYRQKKS
jgi:cytochrome c556